MVKVIWNTSRLEAYCRVFGDVVVGQPHEFEHFRIEPGRDE